MEAKECERIQAEARKTLLVDEREAARLLSISPRTLWGLRNAGRIACVRIGSAGTLLRGGLAAVH